MCFPKRKIIVIIFMYFLSFDASSNNKHKLKQFDLDKHYSSECDSNKNPCYSIEDLIKKSLVSNTYSREQVQLLYQARASVKILMAQILPQIDLAEVVNAGISMGASINTILPFVGFLFPNRWFDWKSSRYLCNAAKEGVSTVLANRAQAIQSLYFDIQMQIWSIRVLEFYLHEIDKLIVFFKTRRSKGPNKVKAEDLAILENIRGKLIFDRAYVDALSAALPQMASAIGLEPDFDWSQLKIESQDFTSINNEKHRTYDEFWLSALEQSTEVRSAQFLIEAAKKTKKSTYFDFLDPSSGVILNAAYGSHTKLAKSNVEVFNIQLTRSRMELSNAIQSALNNYNDAIDSFPGIQRGLKSLEDIRKSVEIHINDTSVPLDINRLIRHLKYAKGQALLYVTSYFYFRSAESDLNRYTWKGKIYDIVHDYITFELPKIIEEARKQHSFSHTWARKLGINKN